MLTRTATALCLCAALLLATGAWAQKSKLNAGYAAFTSKKFPDAARFIQEGLKDTTGYKPKDMAKANLFLAQALNQIEGQVRAGLNAEGLNRDFPNRQVDAYVALRKAKVNDIDSKLAAQINGEWGEVANALNGLADAQWRAKEYPKCAATLVYSIDAMGNLEDSIRRKFLPTLVQLRAFSYLYSSDTSKAINDLMTYLRIAPSTTEDLPSMYNSLVSLVRIFEKNEPKAIAILEEGRQKFPSNDELRLQELSIYNNNPELREKAMGKFAQAYNDKPSDIYIGLNYAVMLEQANRSDEAMAVYAQLRQLPDSVWVGDMGKNRWITYYNTGAVLVNKAKAVIDNANDLIDKKKLDDKGYEAEKNKMKALLGEALPFLEKAHEYEPTNTDVLNSLVQVTLRLEDEKKAEYYSAKKKKLLEGGN